MSAERDLQNLKKLICLMESASRRDITIYFASSVCFTLARISLSNDNAIFSSGAWHEMS